MKYWVLSLFLILAAETVEAALPPFVESKREIEAILSSQELPQYIPSGDTITQIVKTSTGYFVITNHRILPVTVRYAPRHTLGPARFSLEFQKTIEIDYRKEGAEADLQ